MEAYPEDYVSHNLPFIALSGLPGVEPPSNSSINPSPLDGNGLRISSDIPLLSGAVAESLLDEFLRADGASLAWSDQALSERSGLIGFRLKSTGRTFIFPPRKAAPPPMAPTANPPGSPTNTTPSSLELHSPLSPLSPSSPVFPDGLLTPLWLAKHQSRIPSIYLSFHALGSDPSHDNRLKNDINDTKNAIAKSGFKTRYAVVLVSENGAVSDLELEDRVAGIRRATSLDAKTACFLCNSTDSSLGLPAFVIGVLKTLQPICIDYYRDLTKHSRRKRGRSSPPPLTAAPTRGASQVLTMNGWNVRYDFKLAIFAEFRQEMDVAQRHYESALEELFGPEGSLENTPSWSPRWTEARLLCDVIAFRVLRCQIWRGMTSGAAESWYNYKERMRDLIDRRGKGTDNSYGWHAWEARWAKMMAQLIEMAELPVFKTVDISNVSDEAAALTVYAPAEKMYTTMERMMPFHLLHHPGYWWRMACKHIMDRRRRAEAIPPEDRTPLSETPAAQIASRNRTYDTYLVPQPQDEAPLSGHSTYDYLLDLQSQTERVESIFSDRNQMRAVQQVKLDLAREFHRMGRYDEALRTAQPVWDNMIWRRERWYDLAGEILELLYDCASKTSNIRFKIETSWELMNKFLATRRPINFMQHLEEAGSSGEPVHVLLDSQSRFCPLSVTFSFLSGEGFVGDAATCQVALAFNAASTVTPVTISELRVHFNTNIRSIVVNHTGTLEQCPLTKLVVQEEHDSAHLMAKGLLSQANLSFNPGQVRVFDFAIPLRESDAFNATGSSLVLKYEDATLEHVFSHPSDIRCPYWWLQSEGRLLKKQLSRDQPNSIQVLPKPPKAHLQILDLKDQYFTGEKVILNVQTTNGEAEEIDASIRILGQDEEEPKIEAKWQRIETQSHELQIGELLPAQTRSDVLEFLAPLGVSTPVLRLEIVYRLASDPETLVTKTLDTKITFVSPFEANYDFGPRLHSGPYPDFFSLPNITTDGGDQTQSAHGLAQKWCLTSRIVSFSAEPLHVESTKIIVNRITSNALCILDDTNTSQKLPCVVKSKEMIDLPHVLEVRKLSLEDRRPSALDMSLAIVWRRTGSDSGENTTTLLAVPNMTIPTAEPRVLCTVEYAEDMTDEAMKLTYTLENPSMHFLTFNLTMEASDMFAFSGPKYRSMSLTPMSRAHVDYKIFAYDVNDEALTEYEGQRGHWISPTLRVVDAYFQKTLRVLDGGHGVRSGEGDGVDIWIAQMQK